jgi:DNA-binding transcriptional regulator YiaG
MKPFHYLISGLDNVYLLNGYRIRKTAHGESVSIEDIDGLHRAIGRYLIVVERPLRGRELRFLRLEMDLSQKCLGAIIGSNEQSVKRWEKHRDASISSGPADRLLRALYGEFVGADGTVRRMLDRLAHFEQVDRSADTMTARWRSREWRATGRPQGVG